MGLWKVAGLVVAATALCAASGCVERTMKLTTRPPGALAIVNDEEVGITPTSFSFSWYGDYELIFRKQGYKTLRTHVRVNPPWYEIPPIDLVAETLVATTIHDVHEIEPFTLVEDEGPEIASIVQRAAALRARARGEALPRPVDVTPSRSAPIDQNGDQAPTVTPIGDENESSGDAVPAMTEQPARRPIPPAAEPGQSAPQSAPRPAAEPKSGSEEEMLPMTPVEG
ncbi:MAG: PEGA domain-containing protein [Phycisphaerales bacterium]|nr:PEGA domain-containing protein [Phycisphaerales bacterium]